MVWEGTRNHGFSNRPYCVCRYVHVYFPSAPMKNKLFIVRYLNINFAITLKSPIWEYTYTILIKVAKKRNMAWREICKWQQGVTLGNLGLSTSSLHFLIAYEMYFAISIHFVLASLTLCCLCTGVTGSWWAVHQFH